MSAHRGEPNEQDALLANSAQSRRQPASSVNPHWKAHPFWQVTEILYPISSQLQRTDRLIPVVLVMSMSRGLTMSPRIQVYKAIACRTLGDVTDRGDFKNLLLQCDGAAVQARAAKIQASVVTTMSILSAISTSFWSRLGDDHGRKVILSSFLSGALIMEAVFVLVMRPQSIFARHAEKLILVGPIIEGFVGGLSTFNGVVHAYISDCTRHGSRSTIFSTVQGMVFVGLAIGPWIGGLFFADRGYSDGFFIGSISLIASTILYVVFLLPESKHSLPRPVIEDSDSTISFKTAPVLAAQRFARRNLPTLLLPISIFAPKLVPGTLRRNWNMTLCGLSLFLYIVSTGVFSAKYLYAQHVFEWTTAQLGYYMSILWVTRAINLLLFLPLVIPFLKPSPRSLPGGSLNAHDISAEMNFDRYLAGISLTLDGVADSLVSIISSKSQSIFVTLSCLSSFTSGGSPALHSLGAVCLHACGRSSEVGALFGAMGVLSALGHIVSPYIYALTYASTVAVFPEAIFVLAACLLFSVVFFLSQISPAEDDVIIVVASDQPESSLLDNAGENDVP